MLLLFRSMSCCCFSKTLSMETVGCRLFKCFFRLFVVLQDNLCLHIPIFKWVGSRVKYPQIGLLNTFTAAFKTLFIAQKLKKQFRLGFHFLLVISVKATAQTQARLVWTCVAEIRCLFVSLGPTTHPTVFPFQPVLYIPSITFCNLTNDQTYLFLSWAFYGGVQGGGGRIARITESLHSQNGIFAPVWSITTNSMRPITFVRQPELLVPLPGQRKPYDYFRLILDDILVENIVRFSNAYAFVLGVVLGEPDLTPHFRINKWRE